LQEKQYNKNQKKINNIILTVFKIVNIYNSKMSNEIKPEHYLPVILAALTIVLIGVWNPKCFRAKPDDVAKGVPSYKWLALLSLLVGVLTVWCYNQSKE
jgi:hypothetical protein